MAFERRHYPGKGIQSAGGDPSRRRSRVDAASTSTKGTDRRKEESKVVYESKDAKAQKVFDALEWLAAMCSHVPNKGEQMVRYYRYYSNVSRGQRKKQNQDGLISCILEPEEPSKEYRLISPHSIR